MKKLLLFTIPAIILFACDRVENIYVPLPSTELDYSLYPGTQQDYEQNEWPTFTQNTNTDRNILIEDFTGHRCIFCPPAAELAKQLEDNNPGRVYAAAIHTGPEPYDPNWNNVAPGDFQTIVPPIYVHNFANDDGLQIGGYFGTMAGSAFTGNPRGTVSRIENSGQLTISPSNWQSICDAAVAANDLKVNIQAATNYYPSTRGLFLHTEIEVLDQSLTNELKTVVYLIEDSIVKPQKFPGGIDSLDYHHHNVMRGCIDGRPFGQVLDIKHMDVNGKYYFNYSYKVPEGPISQDGHLYDTSNMHLLIYVRDNVTDEIYHVVEQYFD